ncbi:MAG TPA: polyhydroxyalkanoate synthesis regulator DNA-binding domain-containing protein [bacterium]|nr:polyhydroxyalkanoate synthesis regulator DNA-binding domain-containing protein [bacterium]
MERVIKRYQNRKLYDTVDKNYVKLADIERMIRNNEAIRIIDNVSGEDITRQILVQLIMRAEPRQSDMRVPLEGLRDMIQNEDSPLFQAFRGMLNLGRDMVQQITPSRNPPGEGSGNSAADARRQFATINDTLRRAMDRVSDTAVQLVNRTLSSEMLHVPTRDDWNRIEAKFESLEKKLSALDEPGGK